MMTRIVVVWWCCGVVVDGTVLIDVRCGRYGVRRFATCQENERRVLLASTTSHQRPRDHQSRINKDALAQHIIMFVNTNWYECGMKFWFMMILD